MVFLTANIPHHHPHNNPKQKQTVQGVIIDIKKQGVIYQLSPTIALKGRKDHRQVWSASGTPANMQTNYPSPEGAAGGRA